MAQCQIIDQKDSQRLTLTVHDCHCTQRWTITHVSIVTNAIQTKVGNISYQIVNVNNCVLCISLSRHKKRYKYHKASKRMHTSS